MRVVFAFGLVAAFVVTASGCKRSDAASAAASDAGAAAAAACEGGAYRLADTPGVAVAISAGRVTCHVRWTTPDGPSRDGIGIPSAGDVVVGRGTGASYGATVYTIRGGALAGLEAENGHDDLTEEDLEGSPDLDGVYRIVKASTHGGTPYGGTLTITPSGATYALRWETDCACKTGPVHDRYVGVGVRKGDRLLVAWGSAGSDVELVTYTPSAGGALDGSRARFGEAAVHAEKLVR